MGDWREQAACRNEDFELFFPIGTSGPALQQAEQAKAVCRRCPVTTECLDFAIDTKAVGIFGGMDEDERRKLLRRANRQASQAAAAAEKRQRYGELRRGGYSIQQAAWELAITHRHAQRYEADRLAQQKESSNA